MSTTWHARLDWVNATPVDTDTAFELLDALTDHAPAGDLARDGKAGSVMIAVDADDFDDALNSALGAVREAIQTTLRTAQIIGIEVIDSDALDRENAQPIFPEVVGYAEIAEIAGVSRQRARAFKDAPGFPAPVIDTAQGPLMAKAAVEAWVKQRNTKPGRRTVRV